MDGSVGNIEVDDFFQDEFYDVIGTELQSSKKSSKKSGWNSESD